MTSLHQPDATVDDRVRVLGIRDEPLDVSRLHEAVANHASGGVALFVGAVRDHDHGHEVRRLGYTAHPTAERELRAVVGDVLEAYGVVALGVEHRVGDLEIGDLAVVAAVACAHRGQAFDACRMLIDELKARVPIWKHQQFSDGTDEWVGTP